MVILVLNKIKNKFIYKHKLALYFVLVQHNQSQVLIVFTGKGESHYPNDIRTPTHSILTVSLNICSI